MPFLHGKHHIQLLTNFKVKSVIFPPWIENGANFKYWLYYLFFPYSVISIFFKKKKKNWVVFVFVFLELLPWQMEVPRLGSNRSCSCQPTPQSQQCRILNPLSEARDRTRNLLVPSQICFWCTTTGTPLPISLVQKPLWWCPLPLPYGGPTLIFMLALFLLH